MFLQSRNARQTVIDMVGLSPLTEFPPPPPSSPSSPHSAASGRKSTLVSDANPVP